MYLYNTIDLQNAYTMFTI